MARIVELLSTYDLAAVLDLPLYSIFGLLKHAIEKEQEDAAWQMWLSVYPDMQKGFAEFKPFGEFKKDIMIQQVQHTNKNHEDIMTEMIAIAEISRERGDSNGDI